MLLIAEFRFKLACVDYAILLFLSCYLFSRFSFSSRLSMIVIASVTAHELITHGLIIMLSMNQPNITVAV
jgi:hypothetical protein